MDVATIDQQYQLLEQESGQLSQTIELFAEKLRVAGDDGNAAAKEWVLDLKGVALQIQQEQLQVQALLQALHSFAVNTIQQLPPPPVAQPSQLQSVASPAPSGGLMSHFRNGNFGQAMTSGLGMGAAFGLANSVINSIFG